MHQVAENLPLINWSPSERKAWAPPVDITVSQWAEQYRELPKSAAISGRWSNRLGPYAVGVMDAFRDPRVERITIMASIQSMKTECAYNMLGYLICEDPAPGLLVMPTLKLTRKANRRLRTMLMVSEELAGHLTCNPDDLRLEEITLDRMSLNFATAGSVADLQFVEARYLILDETDLYPPGAVKMAIDRTTTFWNRKIIDLSRPTVPEAHINTEYQKSDRRKFWAPCPQCGGYQVLSFWQLKHRGEPRGKWPHDKRGKEYLLEQPAAVVYECAHCQAEIDPQDRPAMLKAGKWVPEGWPIAPDGEMPPPATSHVGFWWNALYSPFKTWGEICAEFFSVKEEPANYRNFVNQWLAEPWKEIVQQRPASAILELCSSRPALEVPDGTLALSAGIDNQKRGFWVSIWAWELTGAGALHQHLVRYGFVNNFEELDRWLFEDVYRSRGGGQTYPIWRGGIDTGGGEGGPGEATQTEQVYNWLRLAGRGRIFGVKGASRAFGGGKTMHLSVIDRMPGGKPIPGGLRVWMLDTNALKDAFWSRVETGRVHLHADTEEVFAAHLAAEAKEKIMRNGRLVETWVRQGRRANHYLDTAIYAQALADRECWGGVMVVRPPETPGPEAHPSRSEGINPITGRPRGGWLR